MAQGGTSSPEQPLQCTVTPLTVSAAAVCKQDCRDSQYQFRFWQKKFDLTTAKPQFEHNWATGCASKLTFSTDILLTYKKQF